MALKPQPRWKQNFRIVASLALAAVITVMLLEVIRDRKQVREVEAPVPGATMIGELTKRSTTEHEPSYNTGNFTVINDSTGFGDVVLVLTLWNYGDAPDSFALQPGEYWKVEKTVAQNWHGHLLLWKLPEDPTPTPMPTTDQLGDPCTLSFVTCPATTTP